MECVNEYWLTFLFTFYHLKSLLTSFEGDIATVEVDMVGNFCVTPATVAPEAMAACLGKLYPTLANSEAHKIKIVMLSTPQFTSHLPSGVLQQNT